MNIAARIERLEEAMAADGGGTVLRFRWAGEGERVDAGAAPAGVNPGLIRIEWSGADGTPIPGPA